MYNTELTRHDNIKDNLLGASPVKSDRKRLTDTYTGFMGDNDRRMPLESVRTTHLPGQVGFLCNRPEYTNTNSQLKQTLSPSKATFDEHHVTQGQAKHSNKHVLNELRNDHSRAVYIGKTPLPDTVFPGKYNPGMSPKASQMTSKAWAASMM